MTPTPAAAAAWKQLLLEKIGDSRSELNNRETHLFDVVERFVRRLPDEESEVNQAFWAGLVTRLIEGEFGSLGHLATALPEFLVMQDIDLRTAASRHRAVVAPTEYREIPAALITGSGATARSMLKIPPAPQPALAR